MAPEQIAGEDVDFRADLYAWGVLAYELLSGAHPFANHASTRALFAAHLSEAPAPLTARRADVPAVLARVIERTLAKDPANRPRSARDMLAEIDNAVTSSGDKHARPAPLPVLAERTFKLSDDVCRRIDRTLLDPRIIGSEMQWLDNGRPSDTLVVCVHGTGLDGEMFREVLQTLPHRVIAPTFLGFEARAKRRVPLTLEAHLAVLRELLASVIAELRPARVLLVGFSSGGDAIMRLAATETDLRIDAALALGVNLSAEFTWLTRRLARVHSVNQEGLLKDLQALAGSAGNVQEWLNVHEYVVRLLRKFQHDFEPLRVVSHGYSRPFEERDREVFPAWYRVVSQRVPVVICVAEDTEPCRRVIEDLRFRHLDQGILGGTYRDDSILIEPDTDHFDLSTAPRIAKYVEIALTRLDR